MTWKVASLPTINNKLLYNFCNARANKKKKFPFFPLYFQREKTVIWTNNYTHLWGESSWTDASQTQSRDACGKVEVTLLQCFRRRFLNRSSKTFKVASDFSIEDGSQKKKNKTKPGEGQKEKRNQLQDMLRNPGFQLTPCSSRRKTPNTDAAPPPRRALPAGEASVSSCSSLQLPAGQPTASTETAPFGIARSAKSLFLLFSRCAVKMKMLFFFFWDPWI